MEKKVITSGYNFVPLERTVFFPDWADSVSQDIPFKDGEDGIIEVMVENVTPLFVGGPVAEGEKAYSCHVVRNGARQYFIPGSTIKGCLRNVLEVISFAKLGTHASSSIGYRDVGNPKSRYAELMSKSNACCGWMYKGESKSGEAESFYISKCSDKPQTILFDDLKKAFPTFDRGRDHETAQCIQESLTMGGELYPTLSVEDNTYRSRKDKKSDDVSQETKSFVPKGDYKVVCTGHMEGKEVAYLFKNVHAKPVKVPDSVLNEFLSIHENTAYFGHVKDLDKQPDKAFLLNRLMNSSSPENGIPVFFRTDGNNVIQSIGITKMYRIAYSLTIDGAIRNVAKEHLDETRADLPETMFGYVDGKDSLKGRVQFTAAFQSDNKCIKDEECDSLKFTGVLGQPKVSFWPLYLDQSKGRSSYEDKTSKIAGRKRYRIIDGKSLVAPNKGNENENVQDTFYPIPAGHQFCFRIGVHNLRKMEIGALLSAITFNKTGGCFHNIGKAKAFGYGKVKFTVVGMNHFKYSMEEYMDEFNSEMSGFYQVETRGRKLAESESLKQLVSIASANHTAEQMTQLELGVFDDYKKNDVQTNLPEVSKQYYVGIDESDKALLYLKARLESVSVCLKKSGDYSKALEQLNQLRVLYLQHQIDLSTIDSLIKKCEDCIAEANAIAEAKRKAESELLDKAINQRASQRSLADRLKDVNLAKNVPVAVSSWLKQSGGTIGNEEIDTIISKLNTFNPRPNIASKSNRAEYEKRLGKEATDLLLSKY